MKFIWIDYLIFAWFVLFVITWTIEASHNYINYWILSAYMFGCGILGLTAE